ncbi:MAG: hypothetical protein CMN05_12630 [Roseibacillus sp.]|jgi:hypothetical protein|nr:hypothetical protein [Roseibacillus sp.]MCP4731826.1 hypothetical protein [Roseibacillus sp.]MDP7306160.1 hypothetical protein [Roseibacillus sp.]MDP7655590.1 hypothetical protein [Roseibacillus sp.]HJM65775.1 hypothetical protein [Roseibacillus sp.]
MRISLLAILLLLGATFIGWARDAGDQTGKLHETSVRASVINPSTTAMAPARGPSLDNQLHQFMRLRVAN